jgi:hypothetical protein
MWWIIGEALIGGLLVGAGALWLLDPTLRTFFRPGFEPTSRDDLAAHRAQQSGDSHGAGQ